jgi:hypothetical protein
MMQQQQFQTANPYSMGGDPFGGFGAGAPMGGQQQQPLGAG